MAGRHKILLVHNDAEPCETLSERLDKYNEFDVSTEYTAAGCIATCDHQCDFDILILGAELVDMDSHVVCKSIRKSGFKPPIIMLSRKASDSQIISGLNAGANDYVAGSFKFLVLLARIRAQLRQYERHESAIFSIGPYRFKPAIKLLIDENGYKIRLTEKEAAVLKFLCLSKANFASRSDLLHGVWGYNTNVKTHTVETHIYRLRDKIELGPTCCRILTTERGGYRLTL